MGDVERALEQARLSRGWSTDDVAERTNLPVAYIEALEEGRTGVIPEGPYYQAYLRVYADLVGVTVDDFEEEEPPPPPPPPSRVPLWAVRITAAVAGLVMLGLVGWQLTGVVEEGLAEATAEPQLGPPDQHVVLRVRQSGVVRAVVDGELVLDRRVAAGEIIELSGRDSVEVDIPAVDAVGVEINGETVVPQGRQHLPRKLVFIDDVGAG